MLIQLQQQKYVGDWSWTPPSGARYPGEPIEDCAWRELKEETGVVIDLTCIEQDSHDWQLCAVQEELVPRLKEVSL
ncbi:MAG: NUDIX hydrolase [Anaerolineales bacterium]|jgi:ADP-ribose pyrophosphatase YjhB (NUDIX family)